ncbi:MAG: PIN domain-containing protein [Nanoarchaeota archaeon]
MRLVIDANVLFTYFWPGSALQQLLSREIHLYSPDFSLLEIKEHKKDIIQRTRNTAKTFQKLIEEMKLEIKFIPSSSYEPYMTQVYTLIRNFPLPEQDKFLKDADYLALALQQKCPLWTNDLFLKKQKGVEIKTTQDILEVL